MNQEQTDCYFDKILLHYKAMAENPKVQQINAKTPRIKSTSIFRSLQSRLAVAILLMTFAACRYPQVNNQTRNSNHDEDTVAFDIDKTVDYIIAGDARLAAEGFSYPLKHYGFLPLLQIRNKADFIRLFPIMFDAGVREKLAKTKAERGWCVYGYRGETFDGHLYRNKPEWKEWCVPKMIHSVFIMGETFSNYYQKIYAQDLENLAPEYRDGVSWVFAYFAAEDDSIYGRIDVLGADERKLIGNNASRYRIMIFRKEQRPNEKPIEIYLCNKDYTTGGIVSEDGKVMFDTGYLLDKNPWADLTYEDKTRGNEGVVRLKEDTPWLEKFKTK